MTRVTIIGNPMSLSTISKAVAGTDYELSKLAAGGFSALALSETMPDVAVVDWHPTRSYEEGAEPFPDEKKVRGIVDVVQRLDVPLIMSGLFRHSNEFLGAAAMAEGFIHTRFYTAGLPREQREYILKTLDKVCGKKQEPEFLVFKDVESS